MQKTVGQSKGRSFIETCAQTIIGYGLAVSAQIIIWPFFGAIVTIGENMAIGLVFMAITFVRGLCIRRFFNWFDNRIQGV